MFDAALQGVIRKDSPRVLLWADLYMRSFAPKFTYAQIKASHTVTRTNGIAHLLMILKLSRHTYVPNQSQTSAQFETSVASLARSVSRSLDPVQSGVTQRNFFVRSGSPFTEIIYLSNMVDPEASLPKTIDYYSGWRSIKPLRLVNMSPMPLTLNVDNQCLHYPYAGPGYGVFALDPAALILKYEAYRREFTRAGEDQDTTMVRYLVDDVINPCLLPDSFALWMRGLYLNIMTNAIPDYKGMDQYWPTESTQIVGAGYPDFLRQIELLRGSLQDKTVHAKSVLWSLPVSPDNTPLAQWYQDLKATTLLPEQYQYNWVDGMAWFSWIETFWTIIRLTGNSSQYTTFLRQLWHPLTQWINNSPWHVVRDPAIQDYIKTNALTMQTLVKSDMLKT